MHLKLVFSRAQNRSRLNDITKALLPPSRDFGRSRCCRPVVVFTDTSIPPLSHQGAEPSDDDEENVGISRCTDGPRHRSQAEVLPIKERKDQGMGGVVKTKKN